MNNPPAFPQSATVAGPNIIADQQGMTLRDYFAAHAMQGLVSSRDWMEAAAGAQIAGRRIEAMTVRQAIAFADAMLKEREK